MTAVFAVRRVRVPLATFLICLALMLAGGNVCAQAISVSQTTLAFDVTQGGSQEKQVTVTNISSQSVRLIPYIGGGSPVEFTWRAPSPESLVLPSGLSVVIYVTFTDLDGSTSNSTELNIHAIADGIDDWISVYLTATVSFNCSGTVATASGGGIITKGAVSLLKGSGAASCSWQPATDLTDPVSCTTFAAPSATTTYTLTVTDSNGICSASDDVTVQVVDVLPPNGSALPSGSILLLMRSTPAPDGYTYLGASTISYGNGKSKTTIQVDVYSKD